MMRTQHDSQLDLSSLQADLIDLYSFVTDTGLCSEADIRGLAPLPPRRADIALTALIDRGALRVRGDRVEITSHVGASRVLADYRTVALKGQDAFARNSDVEVIPALRASGELVLRIQARGMSARAEYSVSGRQRWRELLSLTPRELTPVLLGVAYQAAHRLQREDWKRWRSERASRTSAWLFQYVAEHRPRTLRSCTTSWQCCDACYSGLSLRRASDLLATAQAPPTANVTARSATPGLTTSHLRRQLKRALAAWAKTCPGSVRHALLVPSRSSITQRRRSDLHAHVVVVGDGLPSRKEREALRRAFARYDLHLSGADPIQDSFRDQARALHYALAQVIVDPADGRHRAEVWTASERDVGRAPNLRA